MMLRTFADCTTAVFIHNVKCVDPLDFYTALRVEQPGRVILFDTYAGAALGALTAELVDEAGAAAIANAAIREIREVDFGSTAKKTQVRVPYFVPPARAHAPPRATSMGPRPAWAVSSFAHPLPLSATSSTHAISLSLHCAVLLRIV